MSDDQWLKKWRVENAMALSRVPTPRCDDHRSAREWDTVRFALRQRFGDHVLCQIPIAQARAAEGAD